MGVSEKRQKNLGWSIPLKGHKCSLLQVIKQSENGCFLFCLLYVCQETDHFKTEFGVVCRCKHGILIIVGRKKTYFIIIIQYRPFSKVLPVGI